jgi:hypothetical protein
LLEGRQHGATTTETMIRAAELALRLSRERVRPELIESSRD